MPEIVNQQRKIKIDGEVWSEFANKAIETVEEARGKTVTIAFVSDARMRALNKKFRGKNRTTDVLSFPHESNDEFGDFDFDENENTLGEVVISVEQASRQAAENDLTLELEIKQLILHSILHLCGYDHETDQGEMNKRELELRDKLGLQ